MLRISSYLNVCICLSTFKLLLVKSYVSTDFDVHRNWMAIVYNLPLKLWYSDETSEWTLDYPPLFAVFEFLLALIAKLLNLEDDLELTDKVIRTETIMLYQKSTVIFSDLFYYYAIYRLCHSIDAKIVSSNHKDTKETSSPNLSQQGLLDAIYRPNVTSSIALFMIFNPCLLLIDHIHFQYNGFLSGILFLSVSYILEKKYALGSFWFAILLNLKHIYLYCAPAYGMYLLTSYCLAKPSDTNQIHRRFVSFIGRTIQLGLVVISVVLITFAPFIDNLNSINQIAARLFPFKRGLTHAYWAPNIWCLYNVLDKVLMKLLRAPPVAKFDMDSISGTQRTNELLSSTSGLVQEYEHEFLPSIKPLTTFVLVGLFTLPLVIKCLLNIGKDSGIFFMKSLVITSMTSYMFGWHVHEKAILLVLLPLIPVASLENDLYRPFTRLSLLGTYSILPLLFEHREYLIKITIFISYYIYISSIQQRSIKCDSSRTKMSSFRIVIRNLYNLIDILLIISVIANEAYLCLIFGRMNYSWNPLAKLNKLAFLPLLLTSSLSALGISFTYLDLYKNFLFSPVVDKI